MTDPADDRAPARAAGPVLPWGSFGPILAIHFLGTLGFSLAIPFLVFIVTDLGGAAWTYGLLGATYSAFQFLGFNLFYAGFPIHAATAYGWDVGRLGLFFALLSGLMILAQGPLLALASRHLDRRVVFATGAAFLALALASFQASSGTIAFLGAACFALGNGLAWPTFQARVAELAGDAQGTLQGAVTSAGRRARCRCRAR